MSEVTSHTSHTSYQGDTWVRNWNDLFHTDSTSRQQGGAYVYTNQVVGSKLPNWQSVIKSGETLQLPFRGRCIPLSLPGVRLAKRIFEH